MFRYSDGTETGPAILGFGFSVSAAIRKYTADNKTFPKIFLVTGVNRRGILEIGDELVDDHLNSRMQIFIDDRDTGISIEFI